MVIVPLLNFCVVGHCYDAQPSISILLFASRAFATFFLTARSLRVCGAPSTIGAVLWAIAGGVCVGLFVHQAFVNDVLSVPEVRPSHTWYRLRIVFHVVFIVLLTAITANMIRRARIARGGQIDRNIQPDPENGRKVYADQCAVCHGNDGEGLRQADGRLMSSSDTLRTKSSADTPETVK